MQRLDYKTAEAMKKAGFPQKGHGYFLTGENTREENMEVMMADGVIPIKKMYVPTLEEAINEIIKLAPKGNSVMSAYSSTRPQNKRFWVCVDGVAEKWGATYIQAVCNLYLALKNK